MRCKSVLIVDDDMDIRDTLSDALEDRGFAVATASNGLEALRVLRSSGARPSVILLDLMMPIMDGYGFLEHRRVDPVLALIPLAIVTAGYGVDCGRLNGLEILRKPFDVPTLVEVLQRLGAGGPEAA